MLLNFSKNYMTSQNKKYIIANWKMKLGQQAAVELAKKIKKQYRGGGSVELVVCPSATALSAVAEIFKGTEIKLGVQDIFYHDFGAYTGQISPSVVKEIGCEYAIIGHSEVRKLGETDENVNRKVAVALKHNLTPIICVGETFQEYEAKKTEVVIINQVVKALEDVKLEAGQKVIIAYEPVWVIGSGQAVDHGIFQQIVQIIAHTAIEMGEKLSNKFEVIYGGSVDEDNIKDFIAGNISTGVIVGNNSLVADKLLKIIRNIQ